MSNTSDSQSRAMRREYKRFIGDKKYDYYMKHFDEMDRKGTKISFNLGGLLLSNIWAFHRRLLVPAFVVLLLHFAIIILATRFNIFSTVSLKLLAVIIGILPNIFFGFYGNQLYRSYVETCVNKALHLSGLQRDSFYKENADVSFRTSVMIGIVYVLLIVLCMASLLQL